MNLAIFLLRCVQIGLTMADLDVLEHGEIVDMLVESGNDNEEYPALANQDDFDKF